MGLGVVLGCFFLRGRGACEAERRGVLRVPLLGRGETRRGVEGLERVGDIFVVVGGGGGDCVGGGVGVWVVKGCVASCMSFWNMVCVESGRVAFLILGPVEMIARGGCLCICSPRAGDRGTRVWALCWSCLVFGGALKANDKGVKLLCLLARMRSSFSTELKGFFDSRAILSIRVDCRWLCSPTFVATHDLVSRKADDYKLLGKSLEV